MIDQKDIKVGNIFQIKKDDLVSITHLSWVCGLDPQRIYDSFTIKVEDMVNGRCEIKPLVDKKTSYDVDMDEMAKVVVYVNPEDAPARKTEQVSHPSHYAWLKDLCGVEPMDICRHLDFNIGNSLKYLLRKDKVDGNKTKVEKRVEDLRKAIFYIEDEIKLLENGKD